MSQKLLNKYVGQDINELQQIADRIRRDIVQVAVANGAGHIAPSLSCVDILVALYYGAMNYDFNNPQWNGRDRLIFSKAHGCYGLYAILAERGVIPEHEWRQFYREGSTLTGCMERRLEYGLEAGCGSLGHGLPLAVGSAFGAKLRGSMSHTFCVIGDGEFQEGACWEALQFAVKHRVENLTIIIDHNRLQAMDFLTCILDHFDSDLESRLRGFGLEPIICPGHNAELLAATLRDGKMAKLQMPQVIIAETVKGYGMKCMENVPWFHFRLPSDEELEKETLKPDTIETE